MTTATGTTAPGATTPNFTAGDLATEALATGDGAQSRLDALLAERRASWPAEQFAAHAARRQGIADAADPARFVRPGDVVAPFTRPEVDGGDVVLTDLLATGPVVLIFFRFAGCPACNAALSGYQQTLAPALRDLGAHLVAISPQVPAALAAIKHRHGFEFLVASDPGAGTGTGLIDAFGIGFAPDEAGRAQARADGHDLGEVLGTGRWTLPYPTVVVIDTDRVVRFADVHPDWMVRTDEAAVLAAVRPLVD